MFSQIEKIQFLREFEQAVKIYNDALDKFPRDGTWNSPCAEERCLGCANDCLNIRNNNRLNYMLDQVSDDIWNEWSKNPLIKLSIKSKKE